MIGTHPPTPRSGRLATGGTNTVELLWAQLLLGAILLTGLVSTVAWIALRLEALLADSRMTLSVADMPGVLVQLAAGHAPPTLSEMVAAPWRATLIAAVLGLATAAAALRGLAAWLAWQSGWRHRRRQRERLRSHAWARRRDLTDLLTDPTATTTEGSAAKGRLLVGSFDGRDILVPASTSVMAVAPTRTGKSTRLVVPNLLRWDGPTVVTSVKRDVYDLTLAARKAGDRPVALFDPTGSTGEDSMRWSPLLTSTTFPDATKTATWLAEAAAVEDRQESAKFWETLATKLLAPLLFAAANRKKTMADVSHWVDRSAFDEVATILEDLEDEDAEAAWQAIRDLPEETRGSVLGTAMAIFRAFGSPRVKQATSCTPGDTDNTLNVADILRRNGTIYLISPEHEQTELRPVFVALVQAVYHAAVEVSAGLLKGAPLNPPLLLMLDEAGNIAPLKSLPKIAATGAGQGITLMTIWQDRAQIRELYRDAERTLISNHSTTVWLPGSQDLDTLKLLSDLIGDQWVAASTVSAAPDGGLSVSEGSERMDVAPPAFLRTLDHGTAVMLNGNLPPALIDTHAYYEQPRWRARIDNDTLRRHAKMHDGTGPTTAATWEEENWSYALPDAPPGIDPDPKEDTDELDRAPQPGRLGRQLDASYQPVPCNRHTRARWGPEGAAIPDELSGAPGRWTTIELPAHIATQIDSWRADLTDPAQRRRVLPHILECGPDELVQQAVTVQQLQTEWPHLELSPHLRDAWEECYPSLADDMSWQHPAMTA